MQRAEYEGGEKRINLLAATRTQDFNKNMYVCVCVFRYGKLMDDVVVPGFDEIVYLNAYMKVMKISEPETICDTSSLKSLMGPMDLR